MVRHEPRTVTDFERWVRLGAPDPRAAPTAVTGQPIDWNAARQHWAYQPIHNPAPPAVRDRAWPWNAIDAFILAKLEARGLTPSPPADRRALRRRAYYDLIGLPPTVAEVEAFERDRAPDAFARVVDRLLAAPDTPLPCAASLEREYIPSVAQITAVAQRLVRE